MNHQTSTSKQKPILRGYSHILAFFVSVFACFALEVRSHGKNMIYSNLVYSLSLCSLFGISSFYHVIHWSKSARALMRRLDHSAIFFLIAGTSTPLFTLGIPGERGAKPVQLVWIAAIIGVFQSLIWPQAPKWLAAVFYVGVGWIVFPYFFELSNHIQFYRVLLILIGGILYSVGAFIYALNKPNPYPTVFGYHEIFHLLVIAGAACHFIVIAGFL